MKITTAFMCYFCLAFAAMGQKADSIKRILQNTIADSTKTLLLSSLADELTKSNPQRSFQVAKEGLSLAKRIGFTKGVFENYFSLAAAFQGQAMFDSAVWYFHHALALAEKRRDEAAQAEVCSGLGHSFMRKSELDSSRYYLAKGLALSKGINNYRIEAGIYNNYGNVFLEETNYQKALDYFIQAAKLYENPLADDYGQCLALSNIGNIQYRLGNYDQALNYARQSMIIAEKKSFTPQIGYGHKLLGRIYRKEKKYDEALDEYQQAQKIYLTLGDTRSSAELLQNIGNIHFDKGKYSQALASYHASLTGSKSIPSRPLIASAYSSIGQAYAILKENDRAIRYLDSARVASLALGNKYLVMDTYEALSGIYEEKGDYKKALAMHQRFVQLKDTLTQAENRTLSEETQAKYELEKKEARIMLLEKDKELKILDLERHRTIQVGAAIVLLLVIVIAVLLVNRYRISNRVKRLAEIEEVRNAIARDLHDDIGSALSTINIISKLAVHQNPEGNKLYLRQIAEQSAQMMESMTDMVWSINPGNDSLEKVVIKMKIFTSEILEPQNINYKFSGEETLNGLTLDARKRKNLFLIFKEAINNAAKYSGATEVEVSLKQTTKNLILTVSDNGLGFDPQTTKNGNGLNNMRARAEDLLAQFTLTTALKGGTTIELEMPIT